MFNFFEKASKAVSDIVGTDEQRRQREGAADPAQAQSTSGQAPPAGSQSGGDLLSNIVGVAKNVVDSIGDGTRESAAITKEKTREVETTANEKTDQILEGIGALVGGFQGTISSDVEAPVSKVDSQGGKVQISSTGGSAAKQISDAKKDEKPADFLTGVMGVVHDVVGKMQEGSEKGAEIPKGGATGTADSSKDELDGLAKGFSGLVGGILGGKADDKSDKPAASAEQKTEFDTQPVIDDVEGEIVVKKTKGFTAADEPNVGKPGIAESTRTAAENLSRSAKDVGENVYEKTAAAGGAVVDSTTQAAFAVQDAAYVGAHKVEKASQAAAQRLKDSTPSAIGAFGNDSSELDTK